MEKTKKSVDVSQILIIILIIISLFNGCQTCANRSVINKNNTNISKIIAITNKTNEDLKKSIDTSEILFKATIDKIEENADLILVLEKEIDDQQIKSSGIKQLVNEYRK